MALHLARSMIIRITTQLQETVTDGRHPVDIRINNIEIFEKKKKKKRYIIINTFIQTKVL